MATKTVSVVTGGTNQASTSAADLNAVATDFVSSGVVGSFGNTSGVAPSTGAFAVNAQSSPNMSVRVTQGVLWQQATPSGSTTQGIRVVMNTFEDVTISANASGSTKFDWIYLALDQSKLTNPGVNKDDVATLVVSRSSSASTDNGTPPTVGQVLAIVTVVNAAVSITNSNIADKRVQTGVNNLTFNAGLLTNPYKFSVTLAAAQNSINGSTRILFDTKVFDTGSNVDLVTNKGRFTAPVAGFYQFNGSLNIATGSTFQSAQLFKNGSLLVGGSQHAAGAISSTENVSALVQLAAGDYVELFALAGAVVAINNTANYTWFMGYLVSTL